ncbi:MAG: pirin family protein [Acidiferrobacterales bacterium]|nr:pirin family protein [Acidiferrobacterales bacterium]
MTLTILKSKEKDLGEFSVKRILPSAGTRMVGPFIFFDHMGPADFPPGKGISVRPHPHIGIATVTYLFEGEIIHRDSLGIVQPIQAGAVNVMTAGKGIVHSERSGEDVNEQSRVHGIQSWMALPDHLEECEPEFAHFPDGEVPAITHDGCQIKVIMGEAYGARSPVQHFSPIRYLDCLIPAGSSLELPDDQSEIAVYIVNGSARIDIAGDTQSLEDGGMAVLKEKDTLCVFANSDCHCMVIGGEPLGDRHIWWNFVASDVEKIEQAKRRWRAGEFDRVPGDDEWIPLPE